VAVISFSTVLLDGIEMAEGLSLIAAAGVRCVEPAFIAGYIPFDETLFDEANGSKLATMIAACGLTVLAVSAHTDLGQTDSAARLLRRLDFANGLGARILISNATTVARRGIFDRTLSRTLPAFAAAGVTLALENPGHGRDALIPDGVRGAALVAAYDDAALRLNYDIGNAHTYGARQGSLMQDLAAALPWTAHLHLKDVADQNGNWSFCSIGAGSVGYDAHLAHLLPKDLPLGVEVPLRLRRPGRGDPVRSPHPIEADDVRQTVCDSMAALRALDLA